MKVLALASACVVLSGLACPVSANAVEWKTLNIPGSGTTVDIPTSVFTDKGGRPDGFGQRYFTADGRADLTVQAVPNSSGATPARFLANKHPPRDIQYRRVTSNFFAVSSYKGGRVWYNRCNFENSMIHCVLINYPASEERLWDGIVTRISLSLNGR